MRSDGEAILVLLVEVEPAHVEAIRRAFHASGLDASVEVAGTLREYRELVAARPPQIAIIGLYLPDGRALEVLSSPPEAGAFPVVVMTSCGDQQVAVEAMKAGALDCVVNSPEAFERLPHVVERALREWALLQEHKQAQKALQESEEDLRELVELLPEGIFEMDPRGALTYVNQSAFALFGYSPQDLVRGLSALDMIAAEDRNRAQESIQEVLRGETVGVTEYAARRKDGSVFTALLHSTMILRHGEPVGLRGSVIDITERKQAEEALRESEARFDQLAEQSGTIVWEVDAQGLYTYVSHVAETVWGYRPEELVDRMHFYDLHPEEGREAFKTAAFAVFERKEPFQNLVNTVETKDGGVVWVSTNGIPLLNADGTLRGYQGSDTNITERQRAEEALRKSEERHRTILQTAMDGFWMVDTEGRLLEVNETYCRMSGYSAQQLLTMRIPELEAGETASDTANQFERIIAQGEYRFESRHRRKDGSVFDIEISAQYRPAEGGRCIAFLRDITDRKRAEEDYRTLFREMLDGFALHEILCDARGKPADYRFLAVNPAFERMTGLKAEDALGKTVLEVLPGIEPYWIESYGKVALTGEPASFENFAKELDKHFEVKAFRPAPNQFACIFADVTERRRAEARLLQAQKMESVGRLAGGVAHDFNNLLTVINGYSQLLLGKLRPGDPLWANLEQIHKAGERAARLTGQLLAFSRKQVLQPRVLDLNRLLGEMRPMLERMVGETVEVRVALNAQSGTVCADPHQLEQVLMNLAANARDAMPRGGKLLIETACVERDESCARSDPEARAGCYVMLAVSDSGVGMDEKTRQRIFDPFFTTKGAGQGTGLGLSMVQGIVAQSGGCIQVYSEPGQGTTFKIYLPRVTEAAAQEGVPAAVPARGGKETVLVVEDQAEVRDYAVAVLKAYGYQVIKAENAGEALLLSERDAERIDLVLTDVVMPNVSGPELASRLEKLQPGIKVLFMSGYTDEAIVQHGVLEEGAQFIQKPFSPEQLAIKIREVLGPPAPSARIVVADDEAGVRGFLRAALEEGGYEVTEAADGKQALQQARAGQVNLVITDLVMPEQEGIETIQLLRKEMPGIGIIAISGAFKGQFLKMAKMLGADAVLTKPLSADLLLAKVAEVLKLRR